MDETYGLLTIAGIELALPISALREVVPCPSSFSALPAKALGLVGAIELRRHIVPVVDLRPHLDIATTDEPGVIIIISDGEHLLGLLADRLGSVMQLPAHELMAVQATSGSLFFSHSFRCAGVGIVSVLDVDHILALPGLPIVADPLLNGGDIATRVRADTGEKYTLLEAGPYALALDIQHVFTTLPSVELLPSVIDSDLCKGVTRYAGNLVPVIDPLQFLGLGELDDAQIDTGLVMKMESGYVVLALSRLLDIVDLPATSLMALPEFSIRRPELFLGAATADAAAQVLVLDGAALAAERELSVYASLNTDDVTSDDTSAGLFTLTTQSSANGGESQLVYSMGIELATPLDQISEILPMPETMLPGNGHTMGSMTHRDEIIPVIHLAEFVGRSSTSLQPTCVLLVEASGGHVAFAVDGLRTIDSLAWKDPDEKPSFTSPDRAIEGSPLVQVGSDTTLIPQLDLSALSRLLQTVG